MAFCAAASVQAGSKSKVAPFNVALAIEILDVAFKLPISSLESSVAVRPVRVAVPVKTFLPPVNSNFVFKVPVSALMVPPEVEMPSVILVLPLTIKLEPLFSVTEPVRFKSVFLVTKALPKVRLPVVLVASPNNSLAPTTTFRLLSVLPSANKTSPPSEPPKVTFCPLVMTAPVEPLPKSRALAPKPFLATVVLESSVTPASVVADGVVEVPIIRFLPSSFTVTLSKTTLLPISEATTGVILVTAVESLTKVPAMVNFVLPAFFKAAEAVER